MLCLVTKSLLESFKDVSLNVVRVELAFVFLVLLQRISHILVKSFLFYIDLRLGSVVVPLLVIVLALNLCELGSQHSELLNLRS